MPVHDGDVIDQGDFVDSDEEFEVEDACEDPQRYLQGLYYPICIGETLAGRYRIEHKLGHGGFSTVWMARDTLRKTDMALKIMIPGGSAEREYEMQREIIRTVRDTSHLTVYQDTFSLHGPHGDHRVLVLPLQGPNLRDYQRQKPVDIQMSAARQLLQAIKQLSDGGIVHGGQFNQLQ
jgi:serine/threonine protein kinase